MNKQNLIIYDFIELFSILNEIKNGLNFNLLNVSKKGFTDLKLDHLNSLLYFLFLTSLHQPICLFIEMEFNLVIGLKFLSFL